MGATRSPVDRLGRAADAPARAPADPGGRAPPVPRGRRPRPRRLDASRRRDRVRRPALERAPARSGARLLRPGPGRVPARLPRLLRDAASVRRDRLPGHADGPPAGRLRLHRGHRDARHGAATRRRRARAHRRRRLAGDPRPGRAPAPRGRARARRRPGDPVPPRPERGVPGPGPGRRRRPLARGARRRLLDDRRRGQARLPLLADLGPVRPADGAGLGRLRVERELRRDHLPRGADHGHAGEGPRREALPLLACDDARRLHRPDLGRGPPAGRGHGARADRRPGPAPAGGGRQRGRLDPPGLHHRGAARHPPAGLRAAGALAAGDRGAGRGRERRGRRRPGRDPAGPAATPSGATRRARIRAS